MTKKRLYYNPFEITYPIRYISKERDIDYTLTDPSIMTDLPIYMNDLFAALKSGEFDDIIVDISEHDEAYFPEPFIKNGKRLGWIRTQVVGQISLNDFSNGGGYLKDKHLYICWEAEQKL